MTSSPLADFARRGAEQLHAEDPELYDLISREFHRQNTTLSMVASCSPADPSALACEGSFLSNVTAEGYPGARYHAGCQYVDQIEQLAIDRAKRAFRAQYANVQPHSATTANQTVMSKLLRPDDPILGMDLDAGGHLTHGAPASFSGQYFRAAAYGLTDAGQIDYEQVDRLAREHRPKLIICGTTAYPRAIDFARLRAIADRVGAWLLADITHIAGLVIAGEHGSPIDHAHITTTCTHKQLYGPRGGLILLGRDCNTPGPGNVPLSSLMQSAVFPFFQGAPLVNAIAAKARVLAMAMTPSFTSLARRIVANSRAMAAALQDRGVAVVGGGSDNHIVLADVLSTFGVTGIVAQQALEQCGIIVNKNRIPGDQKPAFVASGIRIGTNSLAARGLDESAMRECADLLCRVLTAIESIDDRKYTLAKARHAEFTEVVADLCRRFPLPGYAADR
jgi:glycine hydroxymethyltransferase